MSERRYIVMTLDDAQEVARSISWLGALKSRSAAKFVERMRHETGADMEEIVRALAQSEPCPASKFESQCCRPSVDSQKLGRRLRRLLERARGERGPGPAADTQEAKRHGSK